MPSDAQIHAVTIYQAPKKTTVQIDKHGFETRQADIVVTALDRPIALVLSAHEPVVWNLLLHPKAKIAGVIVTGTHAQALVGLPQHTPSIIASDLGATPSCARAFPPAPHNGRDLGELARAVTHATGKPVDAVHTAPTDKRFIIGPAHLLQDVPRPPPGPAVPAGYDTVNSILGGKAGLQLAIERGDIRRATQADLAAWIDGAARATQHSKETIDRLNPHNTWVIVRDVRVPPGLHGISYILPSGVSVFGEGGLGTYYRMDDFTCRSGHPIGNRC